MVRIFNGKKLLKINLICTIFILCLPLSWASFFIGSFYRTLTVVLVAIFLILTRGKIVIPKDNQKVFDAWIIYSIYCIFTMFWSRNTNAAISSSMSTGLILLIVIIFATENLSYKNKVIIDYCWIIVGIICAFIFIFGERGEVGEYGSRETLMILGTATDPNEFAAIFIITTSLSIYYIVNEKKKILRVVLLITVVMEIYAVLLSGSRGALMSVIFAILIAVLKNLRISLRGFVSLIMVFLIGGYLIIKYVIPMIPEDVLMRLTFEALLEDGGSGRSDLWIKAIDEVWNGSIFSMLFGYGQGGMVVSARFINNTSTMHNQLLQQLVNYGIIGLGLYLNLIFRVYQNIRIKNRDYIAAFWGMMLMSMTITMSAIYKPLWLLLMMAFTGTARINTHRFITNKDEINE